MNKIKKNTKGQLGFESVAITIGVVAILLVILVLVFSKVANTGSNFVDGIEGNNINETVTGALNTYLPFANTRECGIGELRNNSAPFPVFNTTSYTFNQAECSVNVSCDDVTASCAGTSVNVLVTYSYENESAEQTTYDGIRNTTLNSFDLLVIGLIVLAAVAILGVLFLLGR